MDESEDTAALLEEGITVHQSSSEFFLLNDDDILKYLLAFRLLI